MAGCGHQCVRYQPTGAHAEHASVEVTIPPAGKEYVEAEKWRFHCGRKRCKQVEFSIIRDEPDRGPFEWQEVRVSMCEHGEMAPLLNKLRQQCAGTPKCCPYLRTRQQLEANKGFVQPRQ